MSQVTARKTNINRQVNEIYISFMKAVIVMRKGTRRQLELPDELVVASWPVLASDESDFEDESEDQRTKKSNKKLTPAQVDTNVGAHNKRGTISKVIKTIRVVVVRVPSKEEEGGGRGDVTPPKYIVDGGAMFSSTLWSVRMCVATCLQPALKTVLKLSGSFRRRK